MDNRLHHLTDDQLAQHQDAPLASPHIAHLQCCADCRRRLEQFDQLAAAYREYRDVAPPAPPPLAWAPLGTLIAAQRTRARRPGWWPALAIAAAACAIFAVVVTRESADRNSRQASDLLERGGAVPAGRLISLRFRGQAVVRPAVLEGGPDTAPAALRELFATAHYSWREPLSARSFRDWRRALASKKDAVTIRREGAVDRSYTVRTDSAGSLRSATLTLRAADLQPVAATFSFAGEDAIESSALETPPEPAPQSTASSSTLPTTADTPATPEDTLRVLAALNSIGADVGDPIDLAADPQRRAVVVRAGSLTGDRRREIERVLAPLPRVVMDFQPSAVAPPAGRAGAPAATSSSIPETLRAHFEERLGGPVRLQEITDDVLESSSLLIARAHAFEVLADQFPPAAENALSPGSRAVLRRLRETHLGVARTLLSRIRSHLRPLLPQAAPVDSPDNWIALAGSVDRDLNHLLAGSYSQADGEQLLRRLSAGLGRLDALLHAEGR